MWTTTDVSLTSALTSTEEEWNASTSVTTEKPDVTTEAQRPWTDEVSEVSAGSAAFKFIASVVILAVNLLTIITFCRKRSLRTLSNMLVVSLAVTDLMVGMILFIGAWNWIPSINALISTSGAFCVARLCWYFGCCAVSMLNLSAIACERYLYIVHPYWHQDFVNAKVVGGCICAVWTAGIAYGISPLFIYKYTLEHKCDIYYVLGPAYAIYSAIGVFVFTSILTLVFYSLIARLVWQKRHGTCPSDLARANAGRTRSGVRVESLRKKLRALKAPIVVYGVFFLSWSPYIITYLLHDLVQELPRTTRSTVTNIAFFNSAMNFFVYLSLNGQFRRAVLFELGGCRKGGTEIATVSGQEGSSTQTTGNNTTVPGYVKGVWRTSISQSNF